MCAQTGPCLLTIVHHMKEDPELYLSHPEDNLITCYNSTVYLDKEYSLKLNLRHFDLYKVMGSLVCIFFFTVIESSYLNMSEYGFMSSHPSHISWSKNQQTPQIHKDLCQFIMDCNQEKGLYVLNNLEHNKELS